MNMLLKKQRGNFFFKFLETNDNENTTTQNYGIQQK